MAKQSLVIVESPAKAKTIGKYLGKDYEVKACMGHLRDLQKSKLSVDVDNDFEPVYKPIKGKEAIISDLKKSAKAADTVYLATDPDREGEAISWHLKSLLDLPDKKTKRVTFNEITKNVVRQSIENPRDIDQNLVDAQQARRILDRLVGYQLSPLLWKKIKRGLSAGRVQSVATRMVDDREREIENFKPEEYWTLDANLTGNDVKKLPFSARYHGKNGKKAELKSAAEVEAVVEETKNAVFTVKSVKRTDKNRSPSPPFTTSTMQQEASRKLSMTPRRTMAIAQQLYEGVDIEGEGTVGLITYMRTDSLRISDEAKKAAADYILSAYGESYLPPTPRVYKTKKNAQDAHEAIRPSMPELTPEQVKSSLTTDQYKLYRLIWERFIASQMADALMDTVSVDIDADNCLFKASGSTMKFDGFTVLYEETRDNKGDKDKSENKNLPELHEGDALKLRALDGNQHFTQPPTRYSEASLIKAMEEYGIGRPSTYAPTITTITARNYVEREGKQLKPTVLGEVVTQLMKELFKNIVDVKFTAKMESDLDDVERGEKNWVQSLEQFYGDFSQTLKTAEEKMEGKRVKIPDEETDEVCEVCGKKMVIKIGRFGRFLACSGFPECTNTRKIVQEMPGCCPLCGGKMVLKKSKRGRSFYGCSNFPECNFMTWNIPVAEQCPQCGSTLFQKGGKSGKLICEKPGCGFEKNLTGGGQA